MRETETGARGGWECAERKRGRGRERDRGEVGKQRHPMGMPGKEKCAGRRDRGRGPELRLPRLSAAAPIRPLQGKDRALQGGPEGWARRRRHLLPGCTPLMADVHPPGPVSRATVHSRQTSALHWELQIHVDGLWLSSCVGSRPVGSGSATVESGKSRETVEKGRRDSTSLPGSELERTGSPC